MRFVVLRSTHTHILLNRGNLIFTRFLFAGVCFFTLLFSSCGDSSDYEKMNQINESKFELEFRNEVGESCYVAPDPMDCLYLHAERKLAVPSYPGCVFKVGFEYDFCEFEDNSLNFSVGDFTLLAHDCPEFDQDLIDAISNNALEEFIYSFNIEMYRAIEINILENQPGTSQFFCGTFYSINFEFHLNGCVKYCVIPVEAPHQVGGNGFRKSDKNNSLSRRKGGKYVTRQYRCGESCCV